MRELEMQGFGIYIKNALLEDKHRVAMGESIWLYMWFLDRMTSISENGIGLVLGGKPIKHDDLVVSFSSLSRPTYERYLRKLKKAGYIETLRTPYGLVIKIHKAEKIFGNKSVVSKVRHPDVSNVRSGCIKSETSLLKNDTSNKTIQLDNTKTIQRKVEFVETKSYKEFKLKRKELGLA
jgi:hypothetical protein